MTFSSVAASSISAVIGSLATMAAATPSNRVERFLESPRSDRGV